MTNELLRNAIMKILFRCHPAPVRRPPLAAECEIALGTTITTAEFDAEIAALRRERLIGEGRDGILGHDMYFLTAAGQAEASRAFG
jgi:hypothetical protein